MLAKGIFGAGVGSNKKLWLKEAVCKTLEWCQEKCAAKLEFFLCMAQVFVQYLKWAVLYLVS